MRRGVDARRDAEQDRLHAPGRRGDPLDLVELPEVVDHQQPGPGGDGGPDVGVGLVVAVDDEQLAGRAGGERVGQLALRGDVHPHALVEQDPQEADGRVRLACVRRPGGAGIARKRLAVGPCAGSQRRLVVDVERRPVSGASSESATPPTHSRPASTTAVSGSTDIGTGYS